MASSSICSSSSSTSSSSRDHPLGRLGIALDQGVDRRGELALDQAAHRHDLARELAQILVERADGVLAGVAVDVSHTVLLSRTGR